MRNKLIGVVLALSVALTVTTGASAANATTSASVHPADITSTVNTIQKAYDLFKSFFGGGGLSAAAVNQIISAIEQAESDILQHIDAIAAANARSCAEAAVLNAEDFNFLTFDNQQNFALSTASCVSQIQSVMYAVSDKNAIDQLGVALNAVGPIALATRSRLGFSVSGVASVIRSGNARITSTLSPGYASWPIANAVAPDLAGL